MSDHESPLMREIMKSVSATGIRIFRNNVGEGWVGKLVKSVKGSNGLFVTLLNPRVLHAGLCTGSSDLLGWKSVMITPEMVGRQIAVFVAIEVKAKTTTSAAQGNFLDAVRAAGGIGIVARSVDEALAGLE